MKLTIEAVAKVVAATALAGIAKWKLGPLTEAKHSLPAQAPRREDRQRSMLHHWALQKQSSFVNAEGLLIHTKSFFPPTGCGVRGIAFLVHGYMEHAGRYAHVVEALRKELGLIVHTLDLQGHGRSEGDRVHVRKFDCYVDDLLQFARSRQPPPDPTMKRFLIAHSMGGLIATGAVTRAPKLFDGLVLSGAWLDLDDKTKRERPFSFPLLRVISRVFPKLVISPGLPSEYISSDPAIVRHFLNDPLVSSNVGVRARLIVTVADFQDRLRAQKYSKIQIPLLILHGEADKMTNPKGSRDLWTMCPSSDKTLQILEGHQHEVFNEPFGASSSDGQNRSIEIMNKWIRSRL